MNRLRNFFKDEKIEYIRAGSIDGFKIIRKYLLERLEFSPSCAAVMLVPYRAIDIDAPRNVSHYAVPRDYHIYFEELFRRAGMYFKQIYPDYSFAGFSDHSPIDERDAAARLGLGVIGDSGLLINEKYGSFVFIGELFTDAPLELAETGEIKGCMHCGRCRSSCPTGHIENKTCECLSALSQKKKDLPPYAAELMKKTGCAWGCDICQTVCPMNINSELTDIDFFKTGLKKYAEIGDDISQRAYNWRGIQTIERNLKILKSD